jgi:hypothetical protein
VAGVTDGPASLTLLDPLDALEELRIIEVGCVPDEDWTGRTNEWLEAHTGEWAHRIQREVWESVEANRATAVLSCNNSGKTWLAARIVVKFILDHWRQGVRVVTTAPTAAQVALLLWQEIRAAYARSRARLGPEKVPGKIIGSPYPQWKIGDLVAGFGRKPADHEQSAMQGVHAAFVLAVLDEAGGVAQPIWDAVDKITTNEGARVLAIGNPDDRTAPFGKVTAPGSGWTVIRIDGLRTPNFNRELLETGPYPLTRALMRHEGIPYNDEPVPAAYQDTVRQHLLHPLWVEERFTRWCGLQPEIADRMDPKQLGQLVADRAGASQLFTAAVRGDFPDNAGESVIPLGWYRRATERWADWLEGDRRRKIPPKAEQPGRLILGVDVATTNGADDTVVAVRQGNVVYEVAEYPAGGDDAYETAGLVVRHIGGALKQTAAVIDGIGIGSGVRDILRREHGLPTVSFLASANSGRTDRYGDFEFVNDRAAAWWRLREMLDPVKGVPLALPPSQKLEAELTAPKWWVKPSAAKGRKPRIQVESKDDIRKRLGHSTDRADGVIQAVWVDGSPLNAGGPDSQAVAWQQPTDPGRSTPGRVRPAPTGVDGIGMVPYQLEEV